AVRSGGEEDPVAVWLRACTLGMLRSLALLMTILLSLAVSLTLIDVVGVRWLATQDWTPAWLRAWSAAAMTAVSGLSLAVLGGSSWVAHVLGRREPASLDVPLHATPRGSASTTGTASDPAPLRAGSATGVYVTPFASQSFYRGDPDTMTLRGLHVVAGLSLPAFLAGSLSDDWVRWASLTLLGLDLVVVTFLGDKGGGATTGLTPVHQRLRTWHRVAEWLSAVAVPSAALLLGRAVWSIRDYSISPAVDANDKYLKQTQLNAKPFDSAANWLLYASAVIIAALVVLVSGLAVLAWWRGRGIGRSGSAARGPWWYFRPYSKGCAAIPVAALGLFLGVGYSAAFVVGVSTALGRRSDQQRRPLGATEMLDRVAYAWALGLVPVLLVGLVLLGCRVASGPALKRLALLVHPLSAPFPDNRARSWRKSLAGAIWFARAKNAVESVIWVLFGAGAVLAMAIIAEIGPGWDMGFLSSTGRDGQPFAGPLVQLGSWVLLGLITALVALARGAFRDATLRRTVNIVWDIVAFWPHAVHPFIPTPYSLRTVGDLTQRIRDHLASTGTVGGERQVVVCGHSQGSLVSFAALNLLSQQECDRVGLLTFGSQLRVIFPRAFPLYVNYTAIARLHGRLGRSWVNLYRDTDPLAGPVLSWEHHNVWQAPGSFPPVETGGRARLDLRLGNMYGNDWRLVDPVPRLDPVQPAPVNEIQGHSTFWRHPAWPTALRAARGGATPPSGPSGTA
ncbi:MAG: hypothetical protein ABI873_18950, partial [Marmoricola sp.]